MADPLPPGLGALGGYGASALTSSVMSSAGYSPGMFAPGGGRSPGSTTSHLNRWDAMSGGGLSWMSGGQMDMFVRKVQSLSRNSAGGLDAFGGRVESGVGMANAMGLNSAFGASTAYSSTAFGEAFGANAGNQGFGGLSKNEATALDQQLRITASGSPMANSLGALMALHENGLIPSGSGAAEIVDAIKSRDQNKMNALAQMSPGKLMETLKASGVDPSTAMTFMQSKKSNQQQIAKYSIGDLTRGMQSSGEVGAFMKNNLAAGMTGTLAKKGFDRGTIGALTPVAAEAARQALMGMSPEDMNDPAKRNRAVADAVRAAIGPEAAGQLGEDGLNELAAVSVRNLEGAMGRSKSFGKFKNLQGLVSMNRGDIQSDANSRMGKAKADAEVASLGAGMGGGGIDKAIDAAMSAGPDSNVADVLSASLGGSSKTALARMIAPNVSILKESAGQLKQLQDDYAKARTPEQQAEIMEKMQAVKATAKEAHSKIARDTEVFNSIDRASSGSTARAEAVSAMPRAAGGAGGIGGLEVTGGGSGEGGEMRIRGTLILKPDGTAEIDAGTNRAGDAPAP